MQLKGIAIVPTDTEVNERSIRDLILKIASQKPETLVLINPEGHVFTDAISVDYLLNLKEGEHTYSCDMGILDDMNRIFARVKLPYIFLNPEKLSEFNITASTEAYASRFLDLTSRVIEDYKIVSLTQAPLPKEELLECGRSIREAIETSGHSSVIVVFANLKDPDNLEYQNLLTESISKEDYLPIIEYNPTSKQEDSYDALLIGLGATEQLKTEVTMSETDNEWAFMTFAVNTETDNKDKEFTVPSIIEAYKELEQQRRKELIEAESEIIKLVRAAVTLWINEGKKLDFDSYAEDNIETAELLERLKNQRTGVFVSIVKNNRPRGSMGTINPVADNIAEEIIRNSIEASMYDPQFVPVRPEEIDELNFEVNVLDPPERVDDISELDPEKYGVIVEQGLKRGVVLPGIREIKTAEEQLELAKERAGINEITDSWDPMLISRFTVEAF